MHKILLLYTWFVRTILYFFPDIPIIMRFRGWLYGFGMKECGRNFQVAHNVIINSLEGFSVGDNVYIAMGNILFTYFNVKIEDEVLIGPGCLLTSGNHTSIEGSFRYGESRNEGIIIQKGSWISAHCVILPGANFSKGSVLAASSVLTKKLEIKEDFSIYAGSPAKFIKKIN